MSKCSQKGGNFTSGSTYGSFVNGSGMDQFNRMFSLSSPYSNSVSSYVGAQGQNYIPPKNYTGGKRNKGTRRNRRNGGGVVASVFGQSVVPGTLLALQQSYNKSYKNNNYKKYKNKSFKRKKFSRRR
jgi:hypothetical protein